MRQMMRRTKMAGVLVGALVMVACVSADDRKLIQVSAAAGDGNIREWNTLTDAQRLEDHINMVNAMHALDHNLNGAPSAVAPAPLPALPPASGGGH